MVRSREKTLGGDELNFIKERASVELVLEPAKDSRLTCYQVLDEALKCDEDVFEEIERLQPYPPPQETETTLHERGGASTWLKVHETDWNSALAQYVEHFCESTAAAIAKGENTSRLAGVRKLYCSHLYNSIEGMLNKFWKANREDNSRKPENTNLRRLKEMGKDAQRDASKSADLCLALANSYWGSKAEVLYFSARSRVYDALTILLSSVGEAPTLAKKITNCKDISVMASNHLAVIERELNSIQQIAHEHLYPGFDMFLDASTTVRWLDGVQNAGSDNHQWYQEEIASSSSLNEAVSGTLPEGEEDWKNDVSGTTSHHPKGKNKKGDKRRSKRKTRSTATHQPVGDRRPPTTDRPAEEMAEKVSSLTLAETFARNQSQASQSAIPTIPETVEETMHKVNMANIERLTEIQKRNYRKWKAMIRDEERAMLAAKRSIQLATLAQQRERSWKAGLIASLQPQFEVSNYQIQEWSAEGSGQ